MLIPIVAESVNKYAVFEDQQAKKWTHNQKAWS
jgi:hypothetical protein